MTLSPCKLYAHERYGKSSPSMQPFTSSTEPNEASKFIEKAGLDTMEPSYFFQKFVSTYSNIFYNRIVFCSHGYKKDRKAPA